MKISIQSTSNLFAAPEKDDESGHLHRQLIGYIGLFFPFILWLIAGWRPLEGLERWSPVSSVSGYYYTGSVTVFSGMLVALALFLLTYNGYKNSYKRRDRIAAVIAGVCALLVALFPTTAPGGVEVLSWWVPAIGNTHGAGAIVLFCTLAFFSLFLFTKSSVKKREPKSGGKRLRNSIYIFCGIAMVACLIWAGIGMATKNPIFWPEALALEFFAISWLTKGRADITVAAAGKGTVQTIRHPVRSLMKLRSGITL